MPHPNPDPTDYDVVDAPPLARPAPPRPAPLSYQRPGATSATAQPLEDRVKNVQAPLALLIFGIVVEFCAALWTPTGPYGLGPTLTAAGAAKSITILLVFGTAILLAGALIAAKFRGVDLGHPATACFKLAAVTVASSAAFTILYLPLAFVPMGGLIALVLSFAFYFALLGFLFDLDQSDTWYLVCVIFVIRLAVYFGLTYWYA